MGVTICMPLFGNPGREMEEGAKVQGKDLRTLADGLGDRLRSAADVLDKLTAEGWTARVAVFDLVLTHPKVDPALKAEQPLRPAGADPGQMIIVEDVEDEEPSD